LRLDKDVPDLGMPAANDLVDALDDPRRVVRRKAALEFQLQVQQHLLRTQVHGQEPPDAPHLRIGCGDFAQAAADLGIDRLADEKPAAFPRKEHSHAGEEDADDDRGGAISLRLVEAPGEVDA
jgi:hypothetical protein